MANITHSNKEQFSPIDINITLETKVEAELFLGLFNTCAIAELEHEGVEWDKICRSIRESNSSLAAALPSNITDQLLEHPTIVHRRK
jgi:hypothetical protein